MPTVKVSEETYKKLNKLAGKLRSKTGRPVSFDEVLDYVLKGKSHELSPSDFIGAWSSMTDEEEEEIFRNLEVLERLEAPKRLALDTDVIIRALRGREPEKGIISRFENRSAIATTFVNVYELYYGAFKSREPSRNLASVKSFLNTLDVLEFDDHSVERAGEVMANLESKGNAIDPRDLFSGCIAFENGYAILTRNRKHFERIAGLLVLEPSDIT